MWRAGLIVTHWMAISGARPFSIASADIVVGGADLQRIDGAAIVGGEGDLRPVGEAAREQALDDVGQRMRAQFDEEAVRQLVPDLLERPGLVIGGHAGGGEGVDVVRGRAGPPHGPRRRRASRTWRGSCPRAGHSEGLSGFQTAGQSITSSRPATIRLSARNSLLLVIAVIAAAPFIGGGRHGRAGQREDLHRRAGAARRQPEFEVARRR